MDTNKVKDFTFRHLFHQIVFIAFNDEIKTKAYEALKDSFEFSKDANGILCYGYIDYEQGFTFEVLATAYVSDGKISVNKGNDSVSYKMRKGSVNDCGIYILDKKQMNFSAFEQKTDIIDNEYKTGNNDVDRLRCFTEIDGCRNSEFPDDVMVYITKKNLKPEGVWVRCCGYDNAENKICGIMLNEPNQDFGVHINEEIKFAAAKNGDDIVCISMQ